MLLSVQIPRELFKAEGYAHKEALFGIPVYGGFIAEKLYYHNKTKLCSAPNDAEVGHPPTHPQGKAGCSCCSEASCLLSWRRLLGMVVDAGCVDLGGSGV